MFSKALVQHKHTGLFDEIKCSLFFFFYQDVAISSSFSSLFGPAQVNLSYFLSDCQRNKLSLSPVPDFPPSACFTRTNGFHVTLIPPKPQEKMNARCDRHPDVIGLVQVYEHPPNTLRNTLAN